MLEQYTGYTKIILECWSYKCTSAKGMCGFAWTWGSMDIAWLCSTHGVPSTSHGEPWKYHGALWKHHGVHGAQGHTHGVPWKSMVSDGKPLVFHGKPKGHMEYFCKGTTRGAAVLCLLIGMFVSVHRATTRGAAVLCLMIGCLVSVHRATLGRCSALFADRDVWFQCTDLPLGALQCFVCWSGCLVSVHRATTRGAAVLCLLIGMFGFSAQSYH